MRSWASPQGRPRAKRSAGNSQNMPFTSGFPHVKHHCPMRPPPCASPPAHTHRRRRPKTLQTQSRGGAQELGATARKKEERTRRSTRLVPSPVPIPGPRTRQLSNKCRIAPRSIPYKPSSFSRRKRLATSELRSPGTAHDVRERTAQVDGHFSFGCIS